jgi:hypothetical protein
LVWDTLRRIADALDDLGIPYAVVGVIALQQYGLQRSTQDVDLLVGSSSELDRIHDNLVGKGYIRKSPTSRHLRDDVTRVRIAFLVSGEYPGDGQPKPVRFQPPTQVSQPSDDGLSFVRLETLIEMKLASAKSAPHRIKDRADVLELIHLLSLPASFADRLDSYVQADFRDLAALPPPSAPD